MSTTPAAGPKAKVPIRIGMSAGSYSRKGTIGSMGRCISATRTMDTATSMAILASLEFLVCVFILIPFCGFDAAAGLLVLVNSVS